MPYHCPTDLTQALSLLAETGSTIVAGGTDLYPAMAPGRAPQALLDVTGITDLRGISASDTAGGLRIGGATTWTEIARADLPPAFDGLKQAAREVGSLQIQNCGTIAGNLCNASPAADGVPPLLTLDAKVELTSAARGARLLPLADFITGPRQTLRAPDELLTALVLPAPPPEARGSFEKLGARRYLVISIAMTAALITCDGRGRITSARLAVGACGPVARRLPALEAALIGQDPHQAEIDPAHLSPLSPIDDLRGSAAYRADVVAEQCCRALQKAVRDE